MPIFAQHSTAKYRQLSQPMPYNPRKLATNFQLCIPKNACLSFSKDVCFNGFLKMHVLCIPVNACFCAFLKSTLYALLKMYVICFSENACIIQSCYVIFRMITNILLIFYFRSDVSLELFQIQRPPPSLQRQCISLQCIPNELSSQNHQSPKSQTSDGQ